MRGNKVFLFDALLICILHFKVAALARRVPDKAHPVDQKQLRELHLQIRNRQ